MRGTGLPPPDRHNKVTMVSSLKGPMRDTFLIAAEVLPSSNRISTYSGAATLYVHTDITTKKNKNTQITCQYSLLLFLGFRRRSEPTFYIGFPCKEFASTAISLSCFVGVATNKYKELGAKERKERNQVATSVC
jgi:hypothetical protein